MKITTKEVRETTAKIDDIIKDYKKQKSKKKRDWRTYEQRFSQRVKTAIRELELLVDEATACIRTEKSETRGSKPRLVLKQKVLLLLIKHLMGKSNWDMSMMLDIFSMFSGVEASYKTVERLYSDDEVNMVLHNMHILMLKRKGVKKADCSGDGTGYSLSIKKHYASAAQKLKDKAKESKGENKPKAKKTNKRGR